MATNVQHLFENRKLVVATRHKKEAAILPHLQPALGIIPIVPDDLDTDRFGTFSGEVERVADALNTVRQKCRYAMQQYGCDLGVASEGSFGPHPSSPYIAADDELLIFIDLKHNLEIVVREVSVETNFAASTVESETQLIRFAERCSFPSHALVLKGENKHGKDYRKGLTTYRDLKSAYQILSEQFISITAETDMRAMFNPTRMNVIGQAAAKLVNKILTPCKACDAPGFGVVRNETGLPCAWCGYPTSGLLAHVYKCNTCGFESRHLFPKGEQTADPMYCNHCNP